MPEPGPHTVVLVEGESDRLALETLAGRRDRDLAAEGVAVVPMGGSSNVAAFLERFGPRGLERTLAGLCDAGEEEDLRRALERAGLGSNLSRDGMERLGFYVCERDLEDELIRAVGPAAVEPIIEAAGELGRWRTFQMQPAKRGQPVEELFRRFIGARSGGKAQYAPLLVNALDLRRVPRPLDRLLAHV